VLLCVFCHQAAHKSADQVKRALAREFGVPLHPALVLTQDGGGGEGVGGLGVGGFAEGGSGGSGGGGRPAGAALAAARREALARNARHAAIALHSGGDKIPEARWGGVVCGFVWRTLV
jgi:hypothetical protein